MERRDQDTKANRARYWIACDLRPYYGRQIPYHEGGPAQRAQASQIEDLCDDLGVELLAMQSKRGDDHWMVAVSPQHGEETVEIMGDHAWVVEQIVRHVEANDWARPDTVWSTLHRRLRAGERGYN